MKLYTMFGQRKQRHEGEFGPEVLLCWDEFSVDENVDGWEEACQETRSNHQESFSAIRVIAVNVDQEVITRLLNEPPEITGDTLVSLANTEA